MERYVTLIYKDGRLRFGSSAEAERLKSHLQTLRYFPFYRAFFRFVPCFSHCGRLSPTFNLGESDLGANNIPASSDGSKAATAIDIGRVVD
jgi:hypothetical protein